MPFSATPVPNGLFIPENSITALPDPTEEDALRFYRPGVRTGTRDLRRRHVRENISAGCSRGHALAFDRGSGKYRLLRSGRDTGGSGYFYFLC